MKSLVQFITEAAKNKGYTTSKRAFDAIFGVNDENAEKYLPRVQRNEDLLNVKTQKPATLEEIEKLYNGDYDIEWKYDTKSKDLTLKTNDFEFVVYIAPSETKYILPEL